MLIRSQDNRRLINLNNVTSLTIMESEPLKIYVCFFNSWNVIAEYSTEQKSLHVLDSLLSVYAEKEYNNCYLGDGYAYRNKVFQMPQDNEVK